jgi:carbon storage regulator
MLVLSRKVGQRIWIGDEISVTVVRISGGAVRLGIEAPPQMPVARQELIDQAQSAEAEPAGVGADEQTGEAVPTAAAD